MTKKQSPWKKEIEKPGDELRMETPRDVDRIQAMQLAEQAAEQLKTAWHMNDFDDALWRLVDAAGLTARYANKSATGQESNPTGRGYFVDQYTGLSE